jgi:hypothetical protein
MRKNKRGLNLGNVFYHSVKNISSPDLLSKNVKIGIFESVILPLTLCGYET